MNVSYKYVWECPTCGREAFGNAGHHVRQRSRCLFCLRKANGWTHHPECPGPDEHYGRCVVKALSDPGPKVESD